MMDLHISSLGTLIPEGPWCVFHEHTQGPVANINWHNLLCAYIRYLYYIEWIIRYLYYIEWIIHWYQKFIFPNVFSFQKLFTCKSCISVD